MRWYDGWESLQAPILTGLLCGANTTILMTIHRITEFDGVASIEGVRSIGPSQIPLLSVLYKHIRAPLCERNGLDQDQDLLVHLSDWVCHHWRLRLDFLLGKR